MTLFGQHAAEYMRRSTGIQAGYRRAVQFWFECDAFSARCCQSGMARPSIFAPVTSLTPSPSATSAGIAPLAERFTYRPALDGIRALSVTAVLIYHLGIAWLPGGYLGVDAFFVLSGYLITSLLLVEYANTGRIVLKNFWTRRLRRLMPPMLVVVVGVGIYAAVAATDEMRLSVRMDALSTLLYVANWRFIASGQSYFDEFSAPSPLRHTWSLAIEEQFYLVWPLLALGALTIAHGRARLLAIIAFTGALGSAVAMALLAESNASRAYYGTDARIHELLLGVLLAVAVRRTGCGAPGARSKIWNAVAAGGLVAMLVAFLGLADDTSHYYRGGSLVFAIAVAALILGLEKGNNRALAGRMLSLPIVVWVGVVSYGLYLFHWPIIIWLDENKLGVGGFALDVIRIALLLAVTTVSYYLLERPIRQGRYLGVTLTPGRVLIAVPVLLALATGTIFAGTRGAEQPTWVEGDVGEIRVLGSTNSRAPAVAFVGDSIPKSLLSALDETGKRENVRIVGAAWSGCALSGTFQLDEDSQAPFDFSDDCVKNVPERYTDLINEYDPDIVFMYSVRERFPMRSNDVVVHPGTLAHRQLVLDGLERSYDVLAASGAKVVMSKVVHPARRFKGTCGHSEEAERCAADDGSDGVYDSMNSIIEQFATEHREVIVYELASLVCPDGPPCPSKMDGIILRWDGSHYTEPGSRWLAPLLLDDLLEIVGIRRSH